MVFKSTTACGIVLFTRISRLQRSQLKTLGQV
jgi:hypothetical protein